MIWNQAWFRFKRGLQKDLRTLDVGEPAMTLDTKKVFIGTGTENIELASIEDLATKMDETYIGIPAEKIGLRSGDRAYATSNTERLNAFLAVAKNKTVIFLNEDYYFNNTIYLTSTNKLKGLNTTQLLLIDNDVDFIDLDPFAVVECLRLTLFENHTKICLKLHNKNFMQWSSTILHCIKDVFIYGNPKSISSTGISLFADGANGPEFNVSNLSVRNVTIMWCKMGISIDAILPGWCNGNFFDNIYIQACLTGIYIGKEVGSNRFLYQYQFRLPEDIQPDERAIFCRGFNNVFIGHSWDAITNHKIIQCTLESNANVFMGMDFGRNTMNHNVIDDGRSNIFSGFSESTRSIPQTEAAYRFSKDNMTDWSTASWQQFYGHYSNILHRAHLEHEVTIDLGGSAMWNGEPENVFDRDKVAMFGPTGVDDPIVIEINLNQTINYVPEFGITFNFGYNARYIKFEFRSSDDGEWWTLGETYDNSNYFVTYEVSTFGADVKQLRISLADGFKNPTLNPNGAIAVGCIFMYSNGRMGNYYLPSSGGTIRGDLTVEGVIDLNGNKLKNVLPESGTTAQRPTDALPNQQYFDTTLGKPIWRNAENTAWLDLIPEISDIKYPIPQTDGAYEITSLEADVPIKIPQQHFFGMYSNVLHEAGRRHPYHVDLGDAQLWQGTIYDFFNPQNALTLSATTREKPVILELLPDEPFRSITVLGITFGYGAIAQYVKIEFARYFPSPTGDPADATIGEYETFLEISDNMHYHVAREISYSGSYMSKIRITLADGLRHPVYNPQATINVNAIYAYSLIDKGTAYLGTEGGDLFGPLDMRGHLIENRPWQSGSTAERPKNPVPYQEFFDTTLKRPIWWSADTNEWLDAIGTDGIPPEPEPYVPYNDIPNTEGSLTYNSTDIADGYTTSKQKFYGPYSNALAFANKMYDVTVSVGDGTFWVGSVDSFFDSGDTPILTNTTSENPVVIEIRFPEDINFITEIGITFADFRIPRRVKIEVSGPADNGAYIVLTERTDNTSYHVGSEISVDGGTFSKIRFTFSDGIVHPVLNPSGTLSVGTLYMYRTSGMGTYYLPAKGGKVFGALDMGGQAIENKVWHNGATAERPTNPVAFQEFFDTTLGKPIWRNADNTAWVDANGTTI